MSRPWNILMLARPNLMTYPGGDTTQVLKTKEALEKLGLRVDLNPAGRPDYEQYDLLHFFNMIDPEDILGHIHRTRKPYVLSTIYCKYDEFDKKYRTDLLGVLGRWLPENTIEYLKTTGKWILKGESVSSLDFFWRGHRGSIRYILKNASCLLPNSENEFNRVVKDFGMVRPYVVVPNGVDADKFGQIAENERNLVICVARIEGRKNQFNLIRALNNTAFQVYIVGMPALNQKEYYRKCQKIAAKNIHFTGYVSFEQLQGFYKSAKVHVLPSWFETTGLASLEAALMGCNTVISDRGDVRDYFSESDTWYCDPADPASIRRSVELAFETPYRSSLADKIKTQYNWKVAAEKTIEGYNIALFGK